MPPRLSHLSSPASRLKTLCQLQQRRIRGGGGLSQASDDAIKLTARVDHMLLTCGGASETDQGIRVLPDLAKQGPEGYYS